MSDSELPAPTISSAERQATVDRLCAHFAQDDMTASELEQRLDLAYAAKTRAELVALERDLPALATESESAALPAPLAAPAPSAVVDPSRPVSEHDFIVSVWGATDRKGVWTPARTLTALSIMGGAGLDFRQATFATREIRVRLFTIMGGVEVIVPPGVRVEWNGVALMGGVGMPEPSQVPAADAPLIRITGLVCMGSVDIVERHPGESPKEARKRIRAAKKAQRKLGSGT